MKKLICVICALAMVLSMAACGGAKESVAPTTEPSGTTELTTVESTPMVGTSTPTEPSAPVEPAEPSKTNPETPTIPSEDEETIPPVTVPNEEVEEPSKPTEPSEPVEKPSEPTKPSEPITKPTEPTVKPSEPKPTEPKPTEPKPTESNHEHDYLYRIEKTYTYCTESGYEYHYCSCGEFLRFKHYAREHSLQHHVVNKATHDKEGLANVTCLWCSYTTTEVIPKVNVPYFVKIEMVSCERPNSVYLSDGTQVLDKIYGKYKAAQVGDTYTYRIVMSDGGTTGFTVKNSRAIDADMIVNGNLVTMTVTSMTGNAHFGFSVVTNDIDNNKIRDSISMDIVMGNYRLTDLSRDGIYVTLRDYITRNGMQSYLTLLNEFNSGELTSYTNGDPTKSISGTGKYGYDDYIESAVHSDWLDMYFNLIDAYKARGFTKVYMYYTGYAIQLKAC